MLMQAEILTGQLIEIDFKNGSKGNYKLEVETKV